MGIVGIMAVGGTTLTMQSQEVPIWKKIGRYIYHSPDIIGLRVEGWFSAKKSTTTPMIVSVSAQTATTTRCTFPAASENRFWLSIFGHKTSTSTAATAENFMVATSSTESGIVPTTNNAILDGYYPPGYFSGFFATGSSSPFMRPIATSSDIYRYILSGEFAILKSSSTLNTTESGQCNMLYTPAL